MENIKYTRYKKHVQCTRIRVRYLYVYLYMTSIMMTLLRSAVLANIVRNTKTLNVTHWVEHACFTPTLPIWLSLTSILHYNVQLNTIEQVGLRDARG